MQQEEIVTSNEISETKTRRLDSTPIFSSPLLPITLTYCKSESYLLPSVVDYGGDNYSIVATLYNGTDLPSWIYFDSRKITFLLPKGADPNTNYDLKISINDENGLSTIYKLDVNINSTPLQLNNISDIELVSPQERVITYDQILTNSFNYDLNSSISIIVLEDVLTPYWITETKVEYKCLINTDFNPKDSIKYHSRFQVTDYCGDQYYTNQFNLSVYSNHPPTLKFKPSDVTFYKGEGHVKIATPAVMFIDPGDTFMIYISLCFESNSRKLTTSYNQTGNYINVIYPNDFVNICTLGIVAKDSVNNYCVALFKINVEQCAQNQCSVCNGPQIHDCTECEPNYIMNLRTKECLPILSVDSLGSIKMFGMICFFFLVLHFTVQLAFKLITKKEISTDIPMSTILMLQTVLIVTHFDNNISGAWKAFIDGFQYFKFEFRFLNLVLYISSSLDNKSSTVPDRMYSLYFENKNAVVCFCNFLTVVFVILMLKTVRVLILKFASKKLSEEQTQNNKCGLNIIKNLNIEVTSYIEASMQFYSLCLYSEIRYSWSFSTIFSILVFICMIAFCYTSFYKRCKELTNKEIVKACTFKFYNDIRKLVLCVLFFIEEDCYVLILVPIMLQIGSLLVFLLCNNIKQRFTRIIMVTNECAIIVFCVSCSFAYHCLNSSEILSKIISFIMEIFFATIIISEIVFLLAQDALEIKRMIKRKKISSVVPVAVCTERPKSNDINQSNTRIKKESSIQRSSNNSNKKMKFKLDLNILSDVKEVSLKIEDIESSMQNICAPNEIRRIRNVKKESKVKRLEDSKYLNDEANEEDVSIPKIEIVEYESFYSNNKNNKSFLSAIVQQDENLGCGYNLNCKFNQTPKSARNNAENEPSLLSHGNYNSAFIPWKVVRRDNLSRNLLVSYRYFIRQVCPSSCLSRNNFVSRYQSQQFLVAQPFIVYESQ